MGSDIFHQTTVPKALSNLVLKTSRDGAPRASLSNLCQCLPTPTVKIFFLISNLNLSSAGLKPFPVSYLYQPLQKVPLHDFLTSILLSYKPSVFLHSSANALLLAGHKILAEVLPTLSSPENYNLFFHMVSTSYTCCWFDQRHDQFPNIQKKHRCNGIPSHGAPLRAQCLICNQNGTEEANQQSWVKNPDIWACDIFPLCILLKSSDSPSANRATWR